VCSLDGLVGLGQHTRGRPVVLGVAQRWRHSLQVQRRLGADHRRLLAEGLFLLEQRPRSRRDDLLQHLHVRLGPPELRCLVQVFVGQLAVVARHDDRPAFDGRTHGHNTR